MDHANDICKKIDPAQLVTHVSDYHIAEVARDLVDWEEIAPFLEVTESEQKEIKEDYHSRYNLQKRAALRIWRWKNGDKATYKTLIEIFCSQGLVPLAEQLANDLVSANKQPKGTLALDCFHRYLVDCYCFLPHPSEQNWPMLVKEFLSPHTSQVFVDLTLYEVPLSMTERHEPSSNSIKEVTLSDALTGVKGKKSITLFEGVAGSGKTTLCWHACKEWTEKRLLKQFYLLIHIQLNDPQVQGANSLADFIPDTDRNVHEEVVSMIADQKGDGVCFLFDGLDEARPHLLNTCFDLIMGKQSTKFPRLSFVITTRPNIQITWRLQSILKTKILVTGFSTLKLHEFMQTNLNTHGSNQMMKQFEINPQLEGLCGLPVNAAIMVFLSQLHDLPQCNTQTGIYKRLISNFLVRHVQTRTPENEPPMIETLNEDLPLDIRRPFKHLCELAYLAVIKEKRLFTIRELDEAKLTVDNTLGLLRLYPKITVFGIQRHYSFHHNSVQEFLAALYILGMGKCDQAQSIKRIFRQDCQSLVLPFFAGLSGLSNHQVLQDLSQVLKIPLDDKNTIAALNKDSSQSNDPRRKTLALFHCLFECQDKSLLQLPGIQLVNYAHLSGNEEFTDGRFVNSHALYMTCLDLSPVDCLAIGYFLKTKSLVVKEKSLINFRMGICSDIGMTSFLKELCNGVNKYTPTRILIGLTHSILSRTTLMTLKEALVGQSNIDQLRITRRIGQDENIKSNDVIFALKCIVEGLVKNSSCVSIVLDGFNVKYTQVHAFFAILMIRACTLRDLHYCKADFQKTMPLLSEAVKFSTLKVLVLNFCNIDDVALVQLGNGVCRNRHMVMLTIAFNPYTVNGMIHFLKLFVDNTISVLQGVIMGSEIMAMLQNMAEFYILLSLVNSARSNDNKPPLVPAPLSFMVMNMDYTKGMAYTETDLNKLKTKK